ncbi:hypothetical protein EG68_08529 [Paragonimus skrjabini miyazakii]|uniref:tRNA-5-taurinomethyluridine 2-sulfurtransferase n=1 Tax=Paragonimus skrjabini miyazakii TaxID=59628 RepID=A0A8S9YMJ2_9TREM|nr:hypothetical protein EG68_08529 [Paragonimus skrjabini miyazakii]
MPSLIRSVACAISGGVDSAVSAYLLKKKGFNVTGVFMTNWDPLDEGVSCSLSSDRDDAKLVCEKLDIPFRELNFVREYWIYVFQPLLRCYQYGSTPNPDVLCNRFIKFNLLTAKLLRLSKCAGVRKDAVDNAIHVDALATGHYCQSSFGNFLQYRSDKEPHLLRSADSVKDQTFWLSTISHRHLRHFMFPIGGLLKPTVKRIAAEIGLQAIAARRESMGMCFIGKRRFSDFIESYLTPKVGLFKEFLTGIVLDEHRGIHHYTLGQRANITRANGPFYIAQMDFHTQDIYVVRDAYHPCLFMRKCWTAPAVWINSSPPNLPSNDVQFQWQNKWRSVTCRIEPHDNLVEAAMSVYPCADKKFSIPVGDHLLQTVDTDCEDDRCVGPCLSITLDEPMRCIASGQWAALYAGNRCLGGAMICGSVSLWDEGRESSYTEWDYTHYELDYNTADTKSVIN